MLTNNNYHTLDQVVALAESFTGPVTREMRTIFKAWAVNAESIIGPGKFEIKNTEIFNKKQEYEIPKPDYCLGVKDIAVIKGGDEVKFRYNENDKKIHDGNDYYDGIVYLYETATHFVLDSNDITCIRLSYYSMPIDEDGVPMIPHHHVDAIATYIRAMYEERMGNFLAKSQTLYNRFLMKAKKAKGDNKMPNPVEAGEILQRWTTMLQGSLHKYRN